MEKRERNGCASNFQTFLDGPPIYMQEKLWWVRANFLGNRSRDTFVRMEDMLPLHNKKQAK